MCLADVATDWTIDKEPPGTTTSVHEAGSDGVEPSSVTRARGRRRGFSSALAKSDASEPRDSPQGQWFWVFPGVPNWALVPNERVALHHPAGVSFAVAVRAETFTCTG